MDACFDLDLEVEDTPPSAPAPTLDELGLDPSARARIDAALAGRRGAILLAGFAHTGKTTLSHALIAPFADAHSVVSLEYSIQWRRPGISQLETGWYDHGKLVAYADRALDADVIRAHADDWQSIRALLEAGDRGKLAVALVRSDTAENALFRMLGYGAATDLVCGAVVIAHAQVLLRRLCACARPAGVDAATRAALGIDRALLAHLALDLDPDALVVREPAGCAACRTGWVPPRANGFAAHVPACETIAMDDAVRAELARSAHPAPLAAARLAGTWSMRESALWLALTGVTSLAEVVRTTRCPRLRP